MRAAAGVTAGRAGRAFRAWDDNLLQGDARGRELAEDVGVEGQDGRLERRRLVDAHAEPDESTDAALDAGLGRDRAGGAGGQHAGKRLDERCRDVLATD